MNFTIKTLGCKVNNYESEMIKEQLLCSGFNFVDNYIDANIIIINSCTVTNNANSKSMQMIRNARKDNLNAIIVVCGCLVESNKEDLSLIPADIIIGNYNKSKILEYLNEFNLNHQQIIKFYDLNKINFENMKVTNYSSKTRAFVKIQDGCNNFCSYCIIPFVRGRVRSKEFSSALNEIYELSLTHLEIVLTGIHTGSYFSKDKDLCDLIHEISKFDKLKRIRISSIEITELNDKFLNELKNNNKICDHLHIPIQSGCNIILEKMNRKYDINYYLDKVKKIREIRPEINITTDLIVGFPGETEANFQETIANLKKIKFTKIHVFPYSIRKNTLASKMDNQIPNEIKKQRVKEIIKLSNNLEKDYYENFIGKEVDVLIESVAEYSKGHSSNYMEIIIKEKLETHKIYKVIIDKVEDDLIFGHLV